MPILKVGQILQVIRSNVIIFVPTHARVKKDGKLHMGNGAGKALKKKYPKIAAKFGRHLQDFPVQEGFYGIIPPYRIKPVDKKGVKYMDTTFGGLQTRVHWRDYADEEVIERSLQILDGFSYSVKTPIHCVLPGIDEGLTLRECLKLIEPVNDRVTFWMRPENTK